MYWTLLVLALTTLACTRDRDRGGLPPATDWSTPPPLAGAETTAGSPSAVGPDPHAGVDLAGADPHAGLDMGGGVQDESGGADPHAGLDMAGGDPAMENLVPPDPDRPIDRSRFLRGRITATGPARDRIKPGAILFLSVKPVDPTTGDVIGAPLAVDRLDLATLPVSFGLDESHSMVAGTSLAGAVVISARVDADGEARTRQPGDVEGSVRATIPAEGLELVLDQVVK